MRFYSFTNFYLSSIQQGIQSGHAAVDLLVKYPVSRSSGQSFRASQLAWEWAEDHKTFMCMNGGNSAALQSLWMFLDDMDNPYPFVSFHEDEQSLESVMTSIGIVLPEKIYLTAEAERSSRTTNFQHIEERFVEDYFTWIATFIDKEGNGHEFLFTDWEHELVLRLNTYKLAQ